MKKNNWINNMKKREKENLWNIQSLSKIFLKHKKKEKFKMKKSVM